MNTNTIKAGSKVKVYNMYTKRARTVTIKNVIIPGVKYEATNAAIIWDGDIEAIVKA